MRGELCFINLFTFVTYVRTTSTSGRQRYIRKKYLLVGTTTYL